MPERVTKLQVFVASPGDVEAERDVVERVVRELNVNVAPARRLTLEAVRWETHVRPGVGVDAQDVVNLQIGPQDIFIGILWSRLGTPTRRARSGTLEEYERALEARTQNVGLELMVYFKTTRPLRDDPEAQRDMEEVRAFRQKIQASGITGEFAESVEFERKVRNDLTGILLKWKRPGLSRRTVRPRPQSDQPVVLFPEGYGQDKWFGGSATVGDGYRRIAELTAGCGCVAEPIRGRRIGPAALRGATCLVYAIGPWGESRLEVGELRAIHQFVAEGHALLLLCNYAGPQHHGGNLNDLSARYGLTFEADAVTPPGFLDRQARSQHAARPGSGFEISARAARSTAGQGASLQQIRKQLTDGVRRVITLTPCSVAPRSDAVAVVVSDSRFDVLDAHYTAWSPNVDEWVPTDRRSVPIVAASSVARVAAVGGWKTFLNTFVDDPRCDNARLWENLLQWLCRRN